MVQSNAGSKLGRRRCARLRQLIAQPAPMNPQVASWVRTGLPAVAAGPQYPAAAILRVASTFSSQPTSISGTDFSSRSV